jgi:hypothetical protein
LKATALSSAHAVPAPLPERREVAMKKPKAANERPQWVESQRKFFGATSSAVFADFKLSHYP